jgi:hypothetical protein
MKILDADNLYPSYLFLDLHISVREHDHRLRSQGTDPFFRDQIPNRVALCPGLFDKVLLKGISIPQ